MSSRTAARPYHRQAYLFTFRALQGVQERLHAAPGSAVQGPRRGRHVTAAELCEGFRRTAVEDFGGLAKTVLNEWGLFGTDDVGRIVFELVDRGELSKCDGDRPEDFEDLYDFAEAFDRDFDAALASVHLAGAARP